MLHQIGRDEDTIVDDQVVFAGVGVDAGLGQNGAADVLILPRLVLEVIGDRDLVGGREVMGNAAVQLRPEAGSGDVLGKVAVGVEAQQPGRPDCMHGALQIFFAAGARDQKVSVATVAHRSGHMAFVDAALLGWAHGREEVAAVEDGVAKDDVEGAVILGRARLGGDFDAAATWVRKLGRERIAVDAQLGDGGRGDGGAFEFHAIDDDADATAIDGAGVEEFRQRGDRVLIEDGKMVERLARNRHAILVVRGGG